MNSNIKINISNVLEYIFVQVLIYSPLASILGNLFPTIGGVKFSWLYWAGIFFLSFLVLIKRKSGFKYLVVISVFLALNFAFSQGFDLKSLVNVITSLNIIYIFYIILKHDVLSKNLVKLLCYQFIFQVLVILFLSFGQAVKILPLTLSSEGFVNTTRLDDGSVVERINGFFYHPFDLSVFVYFSLTMIFLTNFKKLRYFVLIVLIVLMYLVKIKMGLVLSLLVFLIYFLFIDKRYRKAKIYSSFIVLILGIYFIVGFIPEKQFSHFGIKLDFPYFKDQFLTGRGAIWNIYLKGIGDHFGTMNYISGYGFEATGLFDKTMKPEFWYPARIGRDYSPSAHNLFLQIFIAGGFLLLLLFLVLLKKLKNHSVKHVYLFIIILPLLTYGITASLIDINFFWAMTMISYFFSTYFNKQENEQVEEIVDVLIEDD